MNKRNQVFLAFLASAAFGADATQPSSPGVGSVMRASPAAPRPLESAPLLPDPVRLGGFKGKPQGPPASFLGEGAFVFERAARFYTNPDGKAVLQFDPDPKLGKDAKPPPPVFVLPNLKRMAIEDAVKGRALPLIVTGIATEFDGHNYLLMDDTTHPAGPPTTAPAEARPATRPATPVKNISSDDLMGELLRTAPGSSAPRPAPLRWDQPPETDKSSAGGAVMPGAPGVTLIREGRYMADRLGRLSRSPDGKSSEFTFDADGKALRDPPLIIMPCAKLAQMQGTALGAGKDQRFRVSGTVSEYRGRNYILPEKVVAVSDASLSF